MRKEFIFRFVFDSLKADATRSLLTLVGVFLGVITAVLIVGVGQGIVDEARNILSTFGTDKVFILPISNPTNPFSGFGKLSINDVNALRAIPEVEEIMYGTFSRARISYKGEELMGNLFFTTSNIFTAWKDLYKFRTGRPYKDNERFAVVLGGVAAKNFFSEEVRAGKKILINGRPFRVVGTLEEIGQAFSSTDDESLYLPFESVSLFNLSDRDVLYIALDVKDSSLSKEVAREAEIILARRHGKSLENKDFIVMTQEYFEETTIGLLGVVNLGALAVGLIASLVSAIGIANTMFTSIMRKKRQIGILRALGTKKRDVLLMFLAEATAISLIGSIAALLIGIAIGYSIRSFVPFSFTPVQVVISLVVGVFIGVLGGMLPAKRATEVSPLEAIRY